MGQYIFLETDGFAARAQARAKNAEANRDPKKEGRRSESNVRRPYRGIQIKEDTYATISVVRPDGSYIDLVSSSARVYEGSKTAGQGTVTEYADFILQQIDDKRAEKQQIIETFGEPFIYFYGEQPRVVSFSGLLMNTEDFNWRAEFWDNYENNLRGTKLVQANARVYLTYDTILLEGYPISAAAQDTSDSPYTIPFQMQMFVTAYYNFSSIGRTRFPDTGPSLDLDVANAKLESARKTHVSTSQQVRQANLDAKGPKGIMAEMRKGIKGLNNLANMAGEYLTAASAVIGGRVIRVPAGVASYLDFIGDGTVTVAQGSTTAGQESRYDFYSKKLDTNYGSVKIRAPAYAKFAPSWVSSITGTDRGFIWENYDEYPKRGDPTSLAEIMTRDQYSAFHDRRMQRIERLKNYQSDLDARVNELLGDPGGGMLEDLAAGVAFAKSAFGMAASAAALVTDVVTAGKTVAGIVGREVKRVEKFIDNQTRSNASAVNNHIGSAALASFSGKSAALLDGGTAEMGESYTSYTSSATANANYENNYGDSNYDSLLAQNPDAQQALTEAAGDVDLEGSDVDLQTLESVYGSGSSTSAMPDSATKALALQRAQSASNIVNDEDTKGIRGIADDDAQIDAII